MMGTQASLKYFRVGMSCCGDDWSQTESSRYDLERLGFSQAVAIEEAEILVVQGYLGEKVLAEVKSLYSQMKPNRKVMMLGTCACGGGLFPFNLPKEMQADVFVTGCPPRPEAIMNGLIAIRGGVE